MDGLRPADEAHGRHAVAPLGERRLRGLEHPRVVGEAEVVVGAEDEDVATGLVDDVRALRGGHRALGLVDPAARISLGELGPQAVQGGGGRHRVALRPVRRFTAPPAYSHEITTLPP